EGRRIDLVERVDEPVRGPQCRLDLVDADRADLVSQRADRCRVERQAERVVHVAQDRLQPGCTPDDQHRAEQPRASYDPLCRADQLHDATRVDAVRAWTVLAWDLTYAS